MTPACPPRACHLPTRIMCVCGSHPLACAELSTRAMLGGRGLLAADTRPAPVKTLSLHEYKARLDQMDE